MPTKLSELQAPPLVAPRRAEGVGLPEVRVLLLAGEPALARVAQELRLRLEASVVPVSEYKVVQAVLQQARFDVVLVEEAVLSENPSILDDLQRGAGDALIQEVNLALAAAPRVVRQVRAALERRREEILRAREAALQALRSELIAAISGLLLESQLALRNAGPELAPALENLVRLAEALARQLQA